MSPSLKGLVSRFADIRGSDTLGDRKGILLREDPAQVGPVKPQDTPSLILWRRHDPHRTYLPTLLLDAGVPQLNVHSLRGETKGRDKAVASL
jgi:hypothetical protein